MTSTILAIDPGPVVSAWVYYDCSKAKPLAFDISSNPKLLTMMHENEFDEADTLAIEMVQSFGMAVGQTVFETVLWAGRFVERFNRNSPDDESMIQLIYRKDVKLHLCNSMRAKDANIRQALIDRFGGTRQAAVGTKKSPGPLYGVKKDIWSALAVAVTYVETRRKVRPK